MGALFRVWCKTCNNWENHKTFIDGDGTLWHDGRKLIPLSTKNHVVVWCTGLKDKNGKDIYDGDILRDEFGRILLVEWRKGGFCFKAITETNFVYAHTISQWFDDMHPPIIIGNVYENPEIIEVSLK